MAKIKDINSQQNSEELAKRFAKNKASKIVGNKGGKATMNNRILPISDFKKVIEHDKIYLGTLQSLQGNLSLLEMNLKKKLTPIIKNEQERLKRAKEFVEWDETRIKLYDVRGQIETHNKLINDKIFHFENIALPQFEKEVADMKKDDAFNKEFDKATATANDVLGKNKLSQEGQTIVDEIREELYWFDQLEDSEKANDEYKLFLFKAIRRLNNALADRIEKDKQNEKA